MLISEHKDLCASYKTIKEKHERYINLKSNVYHTDYSSNTAGFGVWWLPTHPELKRGLACGDSRTAVPTTRPHFLPLTVEIWREYKIYIATEVVRKSREENTTPLLRGTK